MRVGSAIRVFGLVTILATQTPSALLFGQSNACPDTPSQEKARPGAKLIVDSLELQGESPFSDTEWVKLATEIKEAAPDYPLNFNDDRDLEGLIWPIRDELQKKGYFKNVVIPRAFLNRAETDALHYTLNVSIETGPQYHLGNLQISAKDNAPLALDKSLLREQFTLTEGDLFNVAKVRDGLDAMTKLYGSKGFIDMVPTVETGIHIEDSRLDLVVIVDEGISYRISRIEVLGLEATVVQSLQLPQRAGAPFNRDLWWHYFEEIRSKSKTELGWERLMSMSRNTKTRALAITMDYRPCSQGTALPILYSSDLETDVVTPPPATLVPRPAMLRTKTDTPAQNPGTPKP